MSAVIGSLRAELSATIAQFQADMKKAADSVAGFAKRANRVGKEMQSLGRGITLGVTLPLVAFGVKAVKASDEFELAKANVNAALKSMGNAAGFTQKQLVDMAGGLEKVSAFGDQDILTKVTANMLTFGTITGDQFKRAQKIVVDLSTRLGQDLKDSTIQVGKALNDPVRGLTALRRVGVQFTADQEKMIKGMVKAGDIESAQKLILMELEKEFGGAAEAMAKTDAGRQAIAMNQLSDSMRGIGQTIRQVLPDFAKAIKSIADAFESLSPGMREFIVKAGLAAAATGPLLIGIGSILRGAVALKGLAKLGVLFTPVISAVLNFGTALRAGYGVFQAISLAFAANPLGITLIALAAAAIAVFEAWKHWDQIKAFVSGVFEAASNFLGPKIAPVFNALKPLIDAVMQSFKLFGRLIGQIFSGDIAGALSTYLQIWKTVFDGLGTIVGNAVKAIADWLKNKLGAILDWVGNKVKDVTGFFKKMYDAVVGNSWVPDMVEGIKKWFAKLDGVMVKPAKDAAGKIGDTFEKLRDTSRDIFSSLFQGDFKGALAKIIDSIKSSIDDELSKVIGDFGKQTSDSVGGGFFGSIVQGISGAIGDIFGGGRAGGGQVLPGTPYLVGERGPELFVPEGRGRIAPNGTFGESGMNVTYAPQIDARGADIAAVARLERIMAKDKAEFASNVIRTIQSARMRRVIA